MEIKELIAEAEKDPKKRAELDKARAWVREHKDEIIASMVIHDLVIVGGRIVELPNDRDK